MIKYHGTPCSPVKIFNEAFKGRNVLVPFPRPDNIIRAVCIADKIILDNGAFTLWRRGGVINWDLYYVWVDSVISDIEHFFIPDVIDGTEEENDKLIEIFFKKYDKTSSQIQKAIPVWHINESFDRLNKLVLSFDYIAIGSAGKYKRLGTPKWHSRMEAVMREICDRNGYPKCKIHMLRCLDPKIFTRYPFYSGDSTNVARNHNRKGWEPIIERIHAYDSPKKYSR